MALIQQKRFLKKTYSSGETGAQDTFAVDPHYDVTIVLISGSGDSVSVEATIDDPEIEFGTPPQTITYAPVDGLQNIANQTLIKGLNSSVRGIRLNITTNASNTISVEILQNARMG